MKQNEKSIQEKLENYGILDKLRVYGEPLFLMLSGAHNFGFPSTNSDFDIRGVYVAPTRRFLGLRKCLDEPTFEYMSEDRQLDVSIDEVGHFLRVLSKSNGNRLEWVNSGLMIYPSSKFEELKTTVNSAVITKDLLNHYLYFARDMWEGKTKVEGVKKDLYALRVYMVGINIFETGEVVPDINELNKRFNYNIINDMLKQKKEDENSTSQGYDQRELAGIIRELDRRLIESCDRSSLSEKPEIDRLNRFLVKLRERNN